MRELPEKFVKMLKGLKLEELADSLRCGEPTVSIRINQRKANLHDMNVIKPKLAESADSAVPWCPTGYYLSERPVFTLDPEFHQGRYYVQEASSMFHQHIVKTLLKMSNESSITKNGEQVTLLDACAAPGGKTTAVIDALPDGSIVVANEYIPARAAILRENAIKWGFPGIIITRGDTCDLGKLNATFDIVMADVPCSGEGMMRKDPDAVTQWSEGLIAECADRQWIIINNLWNALRPGGYLIYSTCTFNRQENEEMVSRIISGLGGESVNIPIDDSWEISNAIDSPHHCYRFFPGKVKGEGLFVSVIQKYDENSAPARFERPAKGKSKNSKSDKTKSDEKLINLASGWINNNDSMDIYVDAERVTAFPKSYKRLLKAVKDRVDVIHEGILIGTIKGKDLIPSQSLAMSVEINTKSFDSLDLSSDEALHYLHGDALTLPETVKRGFVLLTYEKHPLGFVKNIGNRSNNLYPAAWRIKHL